MAPAIVKRHRQRFGAVAVAAIIFIADSDAEVGGAVYAVDVLNVQIADDGGFGALADREHHSRWVLADALALVHHLAEVGGSERPVEASGYNVIRPAVHRRVVVGDERTDGDLGADQHRGITQ